MKTSEKDFCEAIEHRQPPNGIWGKLQNLIERYHYPLVFLLLVVTALPFVFVIDASIHGDVQLYFGVGESLSKHVVPYRDRELEYPPYAIPLFLLPWLVSHDPTNYQIVFGMFVVLTDSVIKLLLLREGFRLKRGAVGFLPLALYCITIPFIRYFYLQRYDIFPALLILAALICFAYERFVWSGVILGIAAGVKMYPALLCPMLWALAIPRRQGTRFAAGVSVALIPLMALSFFLPWWRFMVFHGGRGLQSESLYAAILWLAHLVGLAEADWRGVKAWMEVTGPVARAITPWAKLLMLSTTLGSVGVTIWLATRLSSLTIYQLARLALIPLLAFVAFNIVLSPQYIIWLLPLAALGILGGKKWPMVFIAVATAFVPIIYPSRQYFSTGLNFPQTLILLARNVGLVVVWFELLREFWGSANRGRHYSSHQLEAAPVSHTSYVIRVSLRVKPAVLEADRECVECRLHSARVIKIICVRLSVPSAISCPDRWVRCNSEHQKDGCQEQEAGL